MFHAVLSATGDLGSLSISSAALPSADRMLIAAKIFPVEHRIVPYSSEQAPSSLLSFPMLNVTLYR